MEAKRDKNMIEKTRQTQWRGWQKYLVDYLKAPVDPRKILMVLDKKGNLGKSILIKYYTILIELWYLGENRVQTLSYVPVNLANYFFYLYLLSTFNHHFFITYPSFCHCCKSLSIKATSTI